MALKAFVDNLESVDETLRGLYVKDGERYKLDAEGVEDVTGLKSALKKERDEAKRLSALAKQFDGIDLEEVERLKKAAEEREIADAERKGEWDKLKQKLIDTHTAEKQKLMDAQKTALDESNSKLAAMQKTIERYLIDAQASVDLAAAKGSSDLLLPHIRNKTKVIQDDKGQYKAVVLDDDGEPAINSDGGHVTIKDLVSEMRQSDVFARAFDGAGVSGSGTLSTTPGGAGRQDLSKLSPTERLKIGHRAA